MSFYYHNSVQDFTLITALFMGRLNPDFPKSRQPLSKESLFWDEPGEATIGRCNATLFRVREFSRTFKGTLALVALCLPRDKSAEYSSPETSMAPQTPLGFPPLYFSLR